MSGSVLKKSVITLAATAAALVCIGGPMAAAAADATGDKAYSQHQAGHTFRHGMHERGPQGGPFSAALRRLNLTAEQKTSIQKLVAEARQNRGAAANGGAGTLMIALGNPGDPQYATAVATAKARAADWIQARSELDSKIYAMLTAEQKAQLPKVLAEMQSRHQSRREAGKSRG
jgi:Spy/CpxP family protein refolding chaperone